MDILKIFSAGPTFMYRLLSRLKADCEYYINTSRHAKHLWAGNEKEQIDLMRKIYRKLCEDYEEPEWITAEEIDGYAKLMMVA